MDMPAGKFKAQCLKIMDEVNQSRQAVTITKHGKPVARLVPITTKENTKSLWGFLEKSVLKYEKPLAPVGKNDWKLS